MMHRPSALTIVLSVVALIIAARMLLYLFHGRQLTRLERYLLRENKEQDEDLREMRRELASDQCQNCS